MQDQTKKLKAIRRLFGQFPELGGPPDESLAERAERLALRTTGYLMALDGFAFEIVEDGVDLVIRGELPGHDGRFVPTAPMLASACRLAAEKHARQRYLNGIKAPRLPAPDIVHSAESQARVRDLAKHAAEVIGAVNLDTTETDIAASKARWEKTNAYFQPPMDEASITKRLLLRAEDRLGYSTGNSDGEEAA